MNDGLKEGLKGGGRGQAGEVMPRRVEKQKSWWLEGSRLSLGNRQDDVIQSTGHNHGVGAEVWVSLESMTSVLKEST